MHPLPPFRATHDRVQRARSVACLMAFLVLWVFSLAVTDEAQAHAEMLDRSIVAAIAYQPPVDAPITDPFRPPLTPYGPGNRGIDFATVPGTSVRAAADGMVVFAGPVAGGLHVTVLHADGIRTTYSFLAAMRVGERQAVRSGDVVGLTGATLHVGARREDTYIDPALLWGRSTGPPAVHLVPLDGSGSHRDALGGPGPKAGAQGTAVIADLAGVAASGAAAAAVGVGPAPA